MRKIGLLGGMSWESSAEYYRLINRDINKRLGGTHSAECLLSSVDFARIEELQEREEWGKLTDLMISHGKILQKGGAECLLICTNTMHLMADEMEEVLSIPLLHIGDVTGEAVKRAGMKRVGLLGTRHTMEKDFYRVRIQEKFGIEVIIPEEGERAFVHSVIFGELVRGIFSDESRRAFGEIIEKLKEKGAEGIILGCTEIPLLVRQENSVLPLFNTMEIHARAAVDWALS
ncbi:MAG: aspartate/glutamate racemase family protein [Spirochaetales bacterium]|nr:aspartate/glutamate racemase family protein [Spirochaetales bacterium]